MDRQIQYIGARYVTKVYQNSTDPLSAEWQPNVEYEPLTMVTYNRGSYLTKKFVPATIGAPVDNPEYWVETGHYNGQIANLEREVANLYDGLDNEATTRRNADNALQNSINAEITARENADSAISVSIAQLDDKIDLEISTRAGNVNTLTNSVNTLTTDLESEVSARTNADANLQAQITQIVAPSGEAPSEAEVENARVGVDGTVYASLGNAIRTQVGNLKTGYRTTANRLATGAIYKSEHNNLLEDISPVTGYYRAYSNGNVVENADFEYFDEIPVKPNTTYLLGFGGFGSVYHICFFDENGVYISGRQYAQIGASGNLKVDLAYGNSNEITSPANAVYMSYSMAIANEDKAIVIKKVNPYDLVMDNIPNKFIGLNKVSEYNMFCKDDICQGYYIASTSGNVGTAETFFYTIIEVENLTKYTVGGYVSVHVAEFDEDGDYITGYNKSTEWTFTTNSETKYVSISCDYANIDNIYFVKGEYGVVSDYGDGAVYLLGNKILEVGSDKPYHTISAAVADANDFDIVKVYAGTYVEYVQCGSKEITIEGVDRDKCILKYNDGDYDTPPLTIHRGHVKNLTIETNHVTMTGSSPAYCVHIDNDYLANHDLYFENVVLHSEATKTIGIGLRANCVLEFKDCSFKCDSGQAAFYCHDDPVNRNSKKQNLNLINCSFENDGSEACILMQTMEYSGSEAFILAQRNIVKNNGAGDDIHMVFWNTSIGGSGFLGSADWTLKDVSALNTLSDLNSF